MELTPEALSLSLNRHRARTRGSLSLDRHGAHTRGSVSLPQQTQSSHPRLSLPRQTWSSHPRLSLSPSTDTELAPKALSPSTDMELAPKALSLPRQTQTSHPRLSLSLSLSPSTDMEFAPEALSPSLSLPDQELDYPTLALSLCDLCLLVICVGDLFCGFLCVKVFGQTWRLLLSLCKTLSLSPHQTSPPCIYVIGYCTLSRPCSCVGECQSYLHVVPNGNSVFLMLTKVAGLRYNENIMKFRRQPTHLDSLFHATDATHGQE